MSRSTTWWLAASLGLLIAGLLLALGISPHTLPFPPDATFSDAAISRYPDALHFQRSIRHELPLWNPHLMGGQPFAANPGAKVWYPFTWGLLIWSPTVHINLLIGLHLWLAGLGMWAWARRTGLTALPAAVAALGYALSPRLVAHSAAGHTDLLMAMAWLPWALYALHHVLCTETLRPARVVLLALVVTLMAIAAPQLVHITFGMAGLYALGIGWRQRARWSGVLAAGGLALGLSAAQWLPLLELRETLSRGTIRAEDAAMFSLQPGQWIGLLIGNHGGGAEGLTYTGISLLVLAGLALLLHPRRCWPWGVGLVVAALYALGENFVLWSALVEVVPPLRWFRVPGRAWLVWALVVPYLAGWGLQHLQQSPPTAPRARLAIVGLIGLGLSSGVSSLVMLRAADIPLTALLGIFLLPLTAALVAWVIFRGDAPRAALWAVLLLVAVDMLWIDRTLLDNRPRDEWLNPTPPALLADLAETGARFYTPDYSIPQQDSAYWGIARFDGVDPFQVGGFVRMAQQATGVPLNGYSTTVPAVVVLEDDDDSQIHRDAPMDAALLGAWGVAWVVTGYPIDIPGLSLAQQAEGLYFYENAFAWGDALRLSWPTPNTLRQDLNNAPGDALRPVTAAPGWDIPAGPGVALQARTGEATYHPAGVWAGMAISGVSLLLCLLALGAAYVRR